MCPNTSRPCVQKQVGQARANPHIGHGLYGERLARLLRRSDVQLNYITTLTRRSRTACIALAAGHLVISEPLSPEHGLQAGVDYIEIETAEQLPAVADELAQDPEAYADVQRNGREQAERFRASSVYPALVREAVQGIEANGRAG